LFDAVDFILPKLLVGSSDLHAREAPIEVIMACIFILINVLSLSDGDIEMGLSLLELT
jgi:hypothetical protein